MEGLRHQALVPQDAHEPLTAGALYTITLHPGGAQGYLPQLYGPLMALYAKIIGSVLEARIRLRVFCTCGARLSHSRSRKSMSIMARAAINAFLKVWMAHSVALTLWLCGSTSCNLHSFLVKNCLICFDAWLSITFNFGMNPFNSNYSKSVLYASKMLLSFRFAIGVVRMEFVL